MCCIKDTVRFSTRKIETAKNFLNEGLSVEQISRCTELSIEIVKNLK